MKLLVDMNLSPRWIHWLATEGIPAEHWSVLGAPNEPDSELMAFAIKNDYIVLTHDLDFGAILAVIRGEKPSVIQIRADEISPDIIGHQIILALRQMSTELQQGALLTIDTDRMRLRLLPLRKIG